MSRPVGCDGLGVRFRGCHIKSAVGMEVDEARRTLASVQLARDHATCGRHGAATALLMQVNSDPGFCFSTSPITSAHGCRLQ